jgi:hypothetical protein
MQNIHTPTFQRFAIKWRQSFWNHPEQQHVRIISKKKQEGTDTSIRGLPNRQSTEHLRGGSSSASHSMWVRSTCISTLAAAFPRTDERRKPITNTRNNCHEQKKNSKGKSNDLSLRWRSAELPWMRPRGGTPHASSGMTALRAARRGEDLSGRCRGGGAVGALGALRRAEGEVRLWEWDCFGGVTSCAASFRCRCDHLFFPDKKNRNYWSNSNKLTPYHKQ